MLDFPILQGRGFRNVEEGGRVTGFSFQLRNPNYRGVAASMLDGVEVVADGERIPDHVPLWTLQGRTFTLDELRASTDVRWQLDEPATITVPKPGGLSVGVHDLEVVIQLRRSYFPPLISRTPFTVTGKGVIVPPVPAGELKYCVSTYSYTGDIYTSMTLEDVFADIADLGATGIEILGEGNIPNYPTPPPAWADTWHGLLQQYGLTATNFGSWVDTTRWHDRDLTAQEGAEQLRLDLRLAKQLGFTSVRPKFGVTTWDLDPHPIWQEAVERSLDLAAELDVVICPEIHAPTPIKHPVTQGYVDFIEKTGTEHFKLLIDTGIFQTAPVLENAEEVGTDDEDDVPPPLRALAVPMTDLAEVLPHTHFIQAKFFAIDDDLHDLHVPWGDIVPTLERAGWNGWLSSEYEGRRDPYRGRDQVRRQHALLRSLQAGADRR
ncbi:C-glycoside deglycosidase beta subunit domain-containing protein [Blastococcus sp. SYSU DS1021]